MTDIIIFNRSQHVAAPALQAAVAAIQTQITRDFAPAWGVSAKLWLLDPPNGAWQFFLQDGLDDPGALGYHTDDGVPAAKIDVAGSAICGSDWRTVLSHEVLEAILDPTCVLMDASNRFAKEACDPVEENAYLIDGVPVSDFVLPPYFGWNVGTGQKYDFRGLLTGPAPTLLPGGYQMEYVNGQIVQHTAFKADGTRSWMSMRATGRSAWRAAQQQKAA